MKEEYVVLKGCLISASVGVLSEPAGMAKQSRITRVFDCFANAKAPRRNWDRSCYIMFRELNIAETFAAPCSRQWQWTFSRGGWAELGTVC